MNPPLKGQKVLSTETVLRREFIKPTLRKYYKENTLSGAFRLRLGKESSLSVNVESLSSQSESIVNPEKFFLVRISVDEIESIKKKKLASTEEITFPELIVEHDPIDGNSAHSLIIGMDESNHELVAKELCRIAKVIQEEKIEQTGIPTAIPTIMQAPSESLK